MDYVRYMWVVLGVFFVGIAQGCDSTSHSSVSNDSLSLFWLNATARVVVQKIMTLEDACLQDQMLADCRIIRDQYNADLDGAHRAYSEMNRRVSLALIAQTFSQVAARQQLIRQGDLDS